MNILKFIIFLVINFGGLAIGGYFTGKGVPSDWYVNLNKAPWTPPGWVFGAAWTTIMICFSIYLDYLYPKTTAVKTMLFLFAISWALNVFWNVAFFGMHLPWLGLAVIAALTALTLFFLFAYWKEMQWLSLLILPYVIWLCIATSLNAYIVLQNDF